MQGAQAGSGAWELRSASPLAQPSPSNKKSRIPSSLGKLDQGTTLGSQSLVASSSGLCLWECWLHACLTVVTKPEIRGLNQAGTCFSPIQQPWLGADRVALKCQGCCHTWPDSLCPAQGVRRAPGSIPHHLFCSRKKAEWRMQPSRIQLESCTCRCFSVSTSLV